MSKIPYGHYKFWAMFVYACFSWVGFVNNSLYQGEIDFQDIPDGRGTYWILPLTGQELYFVVGPFCVTDTPIRSHRAKLRHFTPLGRELVSCY